MTVRYYVLDEEMLGYINDGLAHIFQILHCPGRDPRSNTVAAPLDPSRLRSATKADFDHYRVSWKGHIQ